MRIQRLPHALKFHFGYRCIEHVEFFLTEISAADAIFASNTIETERAVAAIDRILHMRTAIALSAVDTFIT